MRARFRNCLSIVGAGTLAVLAAGAVQGRATALDDAAERYRPTMIEDIQRALAAAHALNDSLAANDLPRARSAWIDSRIGWERSEVFTSGFVPQLDEEIDAWPNAEHGYHGIEAALFGAGGVNARAETQVLITHLSELESKVRSIELPPQRLLNGIARLAYEVGGSKADGGESRLSGTSLNDMRSNVEGIKLAYRTIFADAFKASDPQLDVTTSDAIRHLEAQLDVSDLKKIDPDKLRLASEDVVAALQTAGPKIGLSKPTLEEPAQ